MSREYLATKLSDGRAAAPKLTWWPRHSAGVVAYLAASADRKQKEAKAAREVMGRTALEWESLVPCSAQPTVSGFGFMVEHAVLERMLIDAAAANDAVGMEQIMKSIERNVDGQTLLYGKWYRGFPEMTFSRLLRAHVLLIAKIMRGRMDGDAPARAGLEEERKAIVLALAVLTEEWF